MSVMKKFIDTTIDAFDTFIRTPKTTTSGKVHLRDALDSKRMMSTVAVALTPLIIFSIWNTGYQKLSALQAVPRALLSSHPLLGTTPTILNSFLHGLWQFLPILAVTYAVGLGIEFVFAALRGHEVNEGFLISGLLIPLTLPPDIPLWMVALGTAFGVIFGKEVFGGTGMNFLNPALTARAFIFFSYPGAISGDTVWTAVDGAKDKLVDGFSGATPLALLATAEGSDPVAMLESAGFSFKTLFLGVMPGSMGETSVLLCLVGALILVTTRVASARVMLSMVAGGLAMGILLNLLATPDSPAYWHLPAHWHLVLGGFAFGAVFMATDPVTGAATPVGQVIYGFLIGFFAVIIRVLNPAFPEGVMLAILFMNVFAPLIDHFVVEANVRRRLRRVR